MDVLSDLLHRAHATDALVRQLVQRPPWSMTFADPPPLTMVATLGGHASLRLDGATPVHLGAGDIALVKATGHTIADDPATPPQVVIRGAKKYPVGGGAAGEVTPRAPRTYGDGEPGATTMLRGAYELHGVVAGRLLDMLPPLAVVPAGPRTRGALELLAAEVARDEPGQDAVLRRLLDLVLVLALRAWCARPGAALPAWYRALADAGIGEALRLMHAEPAHRWTVAELAARAGLSRAAFAARFTSLVGEPPLTYLTGWRMTLAADLLRDSPPRTSGVRAAKPPARGEAPADRVTVAAVARAVGYEDPFAFSVAFKRVHGASPSDWRRGEENVTPR
ncbi:AraC family transcriptional regulator [Amycolatopsis sp. cmx-4-68]|uniref:AraC family transcriptional regulator n=1 Tax=Amycolatopsis sp. cmx-4-68 TaxID=2790938 RepID=UPI00397E1B32